MVVCAILVALVVAVSTHDVPLYKYVCLRKRWRSGAFVHSLHLHFPNLTPLPPFPPFTPPPFNLRSPGAPIEDRVADLLKRMNQDEKIAQMALPFGANYPDDFRQYNVTGLGATYPLSGGVTIRNQWQRWQVENTRLGIPTSFIGETLHSGTNGGTVYPMPCLQGSTWNVDLVEQVASDLPTLLLSGYYLG